MAQENKNNEMEETLSEDYSCPSCGAPIKFDPNTSTLECSYCGFKQVISGETSSEEYDLENASEDDSWGDEAKVVKCENCSAKNVIDKNSITSTCPFCGSNQVVDTDELSGIKPQRVIPFKLNEGDASTKYHTWVKKRFLTPSKIKKAKIETTISGVYLPIWTFDTNTLSHYNGRLGKHYTVVRGSGKNRRVETRIRWYRISGIKALTFDDLPVNAGKKISQDEINSLLPYETNDSFLYKREFLVGFSAEHYDVKLKEGWEKAKNITVPTIKSQILRQYIYDVVGYINIKTNYNDITYKYVLIPVWIGNYKYKNKNYRYLVNGETGKLVGKAPVSALKVMLVIFGVLLLAAAIILIALFSGQI